jgi:hypothetical protein
MSAGRVFEQKDKKVIVGAPESKAFAESTAFTPAERPIAKINGNHREELIGSLIEIALKSFHRSAFEKTTPEQLRIICNRYLTDDILAIGFGAQNEPLFKDLSEAVSMEHSSNLSHKENLIYGYNFRVFASQLREWRDSNDKTKSNIAARVFARIERHNLQSLMGADTPLNLKYIGLTNIWDRRDAIHLAGADGCKGFNALLELDSQPESRIFFSCANLEETRIAEALVAVLFRSAVNGGAGVNMAPCGAEHNRAFFQLVVSAKSRVNLGTAPDALDAEYWKEPLWSSLHGYGKFIGITQPTTVTELHGIMSKRGGAKGIADMEARSGRNDEGKLIECVKSGLIGGLIAGSISRKAADAADIRRIAALTKRHKITPFRTIREAIEFLRSTEDGVGERLDSQGNGTRRTVVVRQFMHKVDPTWVPADGRGHTLQSDEIRVYEGARKRFPDAKTKEDLIAEIKNATWRSGCVGLHYALSDGIVKHRQPMATTVLRAIETHWESDSDEEDNRDHSDADDAVDEIALDETKEPEQADTHRKENKPKRKRSAITPETKAVKQTEDPLEPYDHDFDEHPQTEACTKRSRLS